MNWLNFSILRYLRLQDNKFPPYFVVGSGIRDEQPRSATLFKSMPIHKTTRKHFGGNLLCRSALFSVLSRIQYFRSMWIWIRIRHFTRILIGLIMSMRIRIKHLTSMRIRIGHFTSMRIRIRHFTSMRIRIRHFTSMRIRIRHLKSMRIRIRQFTSLRILGFDNQNLKILHFKNQFCGLQ